MSRPFKPALLSFVSVAVLGPSSLSTASCFRSESTGVAPPTPSAFTIPDPFALQFVGEYTDDRASPGCLRRLELRRDGSYEAMVEGAPRPERGAFVASASLALPLTFYLDADGGWIATATAYDGVLHAVRSTLADDASTLRAIRPVGPNEALCGRTLGLWTDDDVAPSTGLYCGCPPPTVYIPSHGGCVP